MKKILLLQTGGTIAMSIKEGFIQADEGKWNEVLAQQFPELNQLAKINSIPLFFEDSSDLNPEHWVKIITTLLHEQESYDGFVVLHGTDTMAFTASAVSFALSGFPKPIVFTGSQVPMSALRSDAKRNLINSIEISTQNIRDVSICFNDFVFRANRTTKTSIGDFDAFASPNFPPVAKIGLNIQLITPTVASRPIPGFGTAFDPNIFILTIFPGMNPDYLNCLDLSKLKAVVIRTFGSGNFPIKGDYSLIPFLENCERAGVKTVIVSQADYDSVDLNKYEAGRMASKLGVLSGGGMTLEATVTKLMYLLAQNLSKEEFSHHFLNPLAGERSN